MERACRGNFPTGSSGGGGKRGYGVKNPFDFIFGEHITDEDTSSIEKNKHKTKRAIKNSGKFVDKNAAGHAKVDSVEHNAKRGFAKSPDLENESASLYTDTTPIPFACESTPKRNYESHTGIKNIKIPEYVMNTDMALKMNEGNIEFSNSPIVDKKLSMASGEIGGYINDGNIGYFNTEPTRCAIANNDGITFTNICNDVYDKDDITKYIGTSLMDQEGLTIDSHVGYLNAETTSFGNLGSTSSTENDNKRYRRFADTEGTGHEQMTSKYAVEDIEHNLYVTQKSFDNIRIDHSLFADGISPGNIGDSTIKHSLNFEDNVRKNGTSTVKQTNIPNKTTDYGGSLLHGNAFGGLYSNEQDCFERNRNCDANNTTGECGFGSRFRNDESDIGISGDVSERGYRGDYCNGQGRNSYHSYSSNRYNGERYDGNRQNHGRGDRQGGEQLKVQNYNEGGAQCQVGGQGDGQVRLYGGHQTRNYRGVYGWLNANLRQVDYIEHFTYYLKRIENAYIEQLGFTLSSYLSLWDSHIFVIQHVEDCAKYINRICTIAELKLVIANHVDCVKALLGRNRAWAFEKQIACTMFVINLLHAPCHRNENWTLNLLVTVAKDLRKVAQEAALDGLDGVDANVLEAAADALLCCFRICTGAKESGMQFINTELMSIFSALKQVNVRRPIMYDANETAFTRFFQFAQQNLCRNYLAPLTVFQTFAYADDFYNYAFENCRPRFKEYKVHLLIRLTPLMLAKNILPSSRVLQTFHLTLFADLSHAMTNGNIATFDYILNNEWQFFNQHGIYTFIQQHVRYNALRNAYQRHFNAQNYAEVAFFQAALQILPQENAEGNHYIMYYLSHGTISVLLNIQQQNMIPLEQNPNLMPNGNPSLNQNN